ELMRWDGSRLLTIEDADAYTVSAAGAAATGADLKDVDLLVELEVVDDTLRFSGVYVHRGKARPRNVAPLVAQQVARGARRPAGAKPARAAEAAPADAGPGADDGDEPAADGDGEDEE